MKLTNVNISKKLPVFTVLLMLLTGGILSGVVLYKINTGFQEAAEDKMLAMVSARESELSGYLDQIVSDLRIQASNPVTSDALDEFSKGWTSVVGNPTKTLQKVYIEENPNPMGEKHKLNAGPNGTAYDEVHKFFHPYFRNLLEERDYYDIFLIDAKGNVLYSVFKELDYATNLLEGQWKDSDLAIVFKGIAKNPEVEKVTYEDFHPYAPSAGVPASFIGVPVFDKSKEFMGALVF